MSRLDAALSGELGYKVEVVLALGVLVLHNLGVDERTRWGVEKSAALIAEEPLGDPLVDDDDSDRRLLLGRVVGLVDGLT